MKRPFVALTLAACSILGKPDVVRFDFVLLTVDSPAGPARSVPLATATLDVDHVIVAAYLDRIEVVTRNGANLITFSEGERWGEVLFSAVPRVLTADLAGRLAGDGVAVTQGTAGAELTVAVTLDRFERRGDGEVALAARWLIERRGIRRAGATTAVESIGTPSATAAASALSRCLGRLSDEIAAAVRQTSAGDTRGAEPPAG
jgi:uncharacterized lipoprotein YmbA